MPPPARPGGPPPPTPEQLQAQQAAQRKTRVATIKQDFVRLTLGMFAASVPAAPLTFGYVGQAEAPQGRADVIDVKGEGTFALRFFVNIETHLPIGMISWQQPPTSVSVRVPGFPPPANLAPGAWLSSTPPAPPPDSASQADRNRYAEDAADLRRQAQAKTIESRLYYADYRDVEGYGSGRSGCGARRIRHDGGDDRRSVSRQPLRSIRRNSRQ